MPIYEFQCSKCDAIKEGFFSMSEKNKRLFCPNCGKKMEQIISPPSFQVKGKYTAKTGYTYAAQNKPLGELK